METAPNGPRDGSKQLPSIGHASYPIDSSAQIFDDVCVAVTVHKTVPLDAESLKVIERDFRPVHSEVGNVRLGRKRSADGRVLHHGASPFQEGRGVE